MPAKDVPAFVREHRIEFIVAEHFDKARSHCYEYLSVAESICVGHRVHLKIKLRFRNPESGTDWRQMVIQFGQLSLGKPDIRRHIGAVKQLFVTKRIKLLHESRETGNAFQLP